MKLKHKIIFMGLYSCIFMKCSIAATEFGINYKNQRGSTMTLILHYDSKKTGTLTGNFTTAVGNCKEDIGKPMPLSGYFNGNAISFVINFPHCKQVIAVIGNFIHDQSKIETLWLDANQINDPNSQNWNSNIIGSDHYERM